MPLLNIQIALVPQLRGVTAPLVQRRRQMAVAFLARAARRRHEPWIIWAVGGTVVALGIFCLEWIVQTIDNDLLLFGLGEGDLAALADLHFVELDLTLGIDAVPDRVLTAGIVGGGLVGFGPLFHHHQF